METTATAAVGVIRDAAEIVFYSVVGAVTIATFLLARKTFFQPRHAAVFNIVSEHCFRLAEVFCDKSYVQVYEELNIDAMVDANIALLFDAYASFAFGVSPQNPRERLAAWGDAFSQRMAVVPKDQLSPADATYRTVGDPALDKFTDKNWPPAPGREVFVPDALWDYICRLVAWRRSPYTPEPVRAALKAYEDACFKLPGILQSVLEEGAAELPQKYPTKQLLMRASGEWLSYRFQERRPQLESLTSAVCQAIRSYLNVDGVFR